MPVLPDPAITDEAEATASFQLLIGGWDAVTYVRRHTGDPAGDLVDDASYQAYAEEVVEEVSRYIPLEYIVGDVYSWTSPFSTVAAQQRYPLTIMNGFTTAVLDVTDLNYRGLSGVTVSNVSYELLEVSSPVSRFATNQYLMDNPSSRMIREATLAELDHYAQGFWRLAHTPSGLAIDLYPIPAVASPVFVRYTAPHVLTVVTQNQWSIPTVPASLRVTVAKLLWASVLEQEQTRLSRQKVYKVGALLEHQSDWKGVESQIERLRAEARQALGASGPVLLRSDSTAT